MAMTLAEIRAKLQASESRKGGQSQRWRQRYLSTLEHRRGYHSPHSIPPDANPKNTFFWVERLQ
jgi:hypothetical protein